MVCYIILAGLCILTKKPGVYIFILSGFVLLVAYRRFLETRARSSYSSPPPLLVRIPCRSLAP